MAVLLAGFLLLPLPTLAFNATDVIQATNQVRQTAGVPVLSPDNRLQRAAQMKADDMATHGYFAHTSPSGLSPWYWFDRVGYAFTEAGENLAKDFSDVSGLLQGWMASPIHRDNIMASKYTDIGVGVATGIIEGQTSTVVVQLFGNRGVPVASTNHAAPEPTPPALTSVPTEPMIHSLVSDANRPAPNLTFSLTEPNPDYLTAPNFSPRVKGASTQSPSPLTQSDFTLKHDLPWLMLAVFLADFLIIVLFGTLRKNIPATVPVRPSLQPKPIELSTGL